MGYDLYILRPGETAEELDRSDRDAAHFGLRNKTMARLGRLMQRAGIADIHDRTSSEDAAETARVLRAFLAQENPGPKGADNDAEMLAITAEFAAFCERASEQGGFVVW